MNQKQQQPHALADHTLSDSHIGYSPSSRRENHHILSNLMRTLLLLTIMVMGSGNVWGQDAVFNLGQSVASYTDNGETITFAGGSGDDVHTGYTDLAKNATITFSGKQLRYIRVTFHDDNEYTLKWGGAWSEAELNPGTTATGTGSVILISNSGTSFLRILNEGETAVPIAKIEVYYWNNGYQSTGDQTADKATKNISNNVEANNFTVDLSKINVVGQYASFGTNGNGAMLKGSGDHYLSIKFDNPADLSGMSYFQINGTNVDKTQGGIFNMVQFVCTSGNVDKYNNPSKTSFEETQKTTLQSVNEIRLYNGDFEGSFNISSIKFVYEQKVNVNRTNLPSGCDAWFTIAGDETQYRSEKTVAVGTQVTYTMSSSDSHHTPSGWRTSPWADPDYGWMGNNASFTTTVRKSAAGTETNEQRLYGDLNPTPEFYNLFFVKATAGDGGSASVSDANGHDMNNGYNGSQYSGDGGKTGTLTFTATPNSGYLFEGWYNGSSKVSGDNPYEYGVYNPDDKTTDLTLTAKFKKAYNVNIKVEPSTLTPTIDIFFHEHKDDWNHVTNNTLVGEYSNLHASVSDVAGYTFVGWYNASGVKIDDAAQSDYHFTEAITSDVTLTAKFEVTKNITLKPDCGGVYLGQNNLNKGTVNSLTITDGKGTVTTEGGGYVSFNFAEGYNFTELYKWTVNCDNNSNVDYVAFCKNGEIIKRSSDDKPMQFYNGATDRTLEDEYKSVLTSVDEIRIGFKKNTTTTINYFYLQTKPDVMYKVPTLASPTTTEMTLFEGETLKLHITDVNGFWREYTDDNYNVEKKDRICKTQNEWISSYDFEDLPIGDYYFNVRHGGYCELGHYHTTDPVNVHVKVRKAINSIEVNGTERQYDLYTPTDISGTVGVVFSLHGASSDYDDKRVDFNAIADANKSDNDKKFVVVYPRGIMRELRGQERGWESYNEDGVEDVEFFKAVVKEINDKANGLTVDYSRIYLAGFANGGMMAYKAAHQAGDFFAAFASVNGFPVNESHLLHAGSQPTPFIHIQGEDNNIFTSKTYDYLTIAHNMTYRNGAHFNAYDTSNNSDGGVVPTNDNVIREIHVADEGGAAYFLYTIKGMGHEYSHSWDGVEGDDVATSIWNFFNLQDKVKNIDKTLKFRMNDPDELWNIASTEKSSQQVQVGYIGFDNVNNGTTVLTYGGRTKTDNGNTTYDKDSNNRNIWHSLQFEGGINGAPHYLTLNVETTAAENSEDYFLVSLTKVGATTPVFAKRYQAGKGKKDLYINFSALPDFNEYKLSITRSRPDLVVKVHNVEFHSGKCQDIDKTENDTYYFDVASILTGMNPIYQPVYGNTYDGLAKEYLPIADIPVGGEPKTIEDNLKVDGTAKTSIPSTLVTTWNSDNTATLSGQQFLNIAVSGHETAGSDYLNHKSNNACILVRDDGDGDTHNYIVDKTKGIKISQFGRAQMPEYLNGKRGTFPTHGVIAIKVQGTLDFYLLAQNDKSYTTDVNAGRSMLKVYYTNDQLNNELKELKDWWFFGTRAEGYTSDTNGNSQSPLSVGVRLPHLGKDGTCTLFITYEGNGKGYPFEEEAAGNNVWIKGFVIKRPDLKVTIGRTDNKYKEQKYGGEDNTFCTRFGENKPYIWSFENVGFNNTKNSDLNDKKINKNDWRTYVCGGTDDSQDHLLVYSNLDSGNDNDKAQFDGRVAGQEHIEFRAASKYLMNDDPTAAEHGRLKFNPIESNGLKVNVTGSGWFKIKCSAPNGPVNMKVYSSTNYGITYINLLREFKVEKTASDVDWHEYTVYLKGHVNRKADNQKGFWDGEPAESKDAAANAEEIIRMSLYVVFDEIQGTTYEEGHPQLNIHQLSWLNEQPADYVFQREEDPKLLTEWQSIRRDASGNKSTNESDPVILYWKAGNDNDKEYPILKENNTDTYNVNSQFTTTITNNKGVKSPGGNASCTVPSDAGTYDAYWDIAARPQTNAHTEKAYANGGKVFTSDNEFKHVENRGNTEFDIPISGSFIRICAMKNTRVVAHVIPGSVSSASSINAGVNGKSGGAVYVLDETGAPIPLKLNGSNLDDDAKTRGYVVAMENFDGAQDGGAKTVGGTMRIDFCANAGKEYFICAKDASISLARLEVHDWRYKPTKSETKLELTDNANNSEAITSAYNTGEFYRDASLTRTLSAGKWASIVLPFSLNEKKFKEIFGEDAKCIHFTDVDREHNTVKLTHHYYNMIVAGRPVFIRPSNDVTNPEFTDITLQAATVKNTTTTSGFTFFASYNNETMNKNDLYLNNANAIKYLAAESATYPGMRSFIKSPSGYDPSKGSNAAKAVFFTFFDMEEDIPTDIEELITEEFGENVVIITKSTKVYDLNGRVVAEGTDINSLPAGLYIVNGKKYIVK